MADRSHLEPRSQHLERELPARTCLYIVGAADDLFEYQAISQGG